MTNVNDNRDDTTPPGNGPYGEPQAARDRSHWEQFPLPQSFPMPHPFDTPTQQLVDRLVVAQRRGDHVTFGEILDRLCDIRDERSNSGARAPIQGDS